MNNILIKKGLDIQLKGAPSNKIKENTEIEKIKLHPSAIYGIKPKLACSVNDEVKIGTELFFDKVDPTVKFISNCSGKIKNIKLGDRRAIDEIEIENNNKNDHQKSYDNFTASEITNIDQIELINMLKESGYWSYIRQRPFSKIANSVNLPKSIFVSCFNTAPHAVNLDLLLDNNKESFQAGINALCKVSSLNYIHLSISKKSNLEFYKSLYNVDLHCFDGPHPTGNVGIQIHHIDPINVGELVWYIDLQDLISIGNFLNQGKIDNTKVITLSGEPLSSPSHVKIIKGSVINKIINEDLNTDNNRFLSGNVLTGKISSNKDGLGYYHSQVAVIPESNKREFLGWLMPGLNKYTFSNTYLSKLFSKKEWSLNTLVNGSYRSIIPFGYWEDVLPMDILPQYLIKSILAEDIEEMEGLGIYECDEEDFALCSFVCQSKIPVQHIIKDGLRLMESEG